MAVKKAVENLKLIEERHQSEISTLQKKVRKLQKENRDLRSENEHLVFQNKICSHRYQQNQIRKAKAQRMYVDPEEVTETTAPINQGDH
jgi:hypothetical protein